MKLKRGNYDGASEFAYFDRDVHSMSLEECRRLLECILHRAMPGEDHADVMFRELAIAEQVYAESVPLRKP